MTLRDTSGDGCERLSGGRSAPVRPVLLPARVSAGLLGTGGALASFGQGSADGEQLAGECGPLFPGGVGSLLGPVDGDLGALGPPLGDVGAGVPLSLDGLLTAGVGLGPASRSPA